MAAGGWPCDLHRDGFDEDEGKHALLVHEPGSDLIGPSKAMSDDSTVLVDLRQTSTAWRPRSFRSGRACRCTTPAIRRGRTTKRERRTARRVATSIASNNNNNNNNNNKDSGDKRSAATIAEQQSEHWQRQARAPVPPTIARHARKAVWEKKLEPGASG